jgi:thymidylate synthase
MKQYLDLVRHVLDNGERREDRTGTGTISVFGAQTRYDLRDGFPLVTTKKVLFDAVARELFWFLGGCTNTHEQNLRDHTPIWDAWADPDGNLGPIYGFQWRNWNGQGLDQIENAIDLIKRSPASRRIIVSAWNPGQLGEMRLPPCHILFQFYVSASGRLDCQLYQRSADLGLGVPFNIASYALLLTMIAQECGLTPGVFVHTLGDAHIYRNHVEGLREQLTREPLPLPRVSIASKPFAELGLEDIQLHDYQHHPFIRLPVAV